MSVYREQSSELILDTRYALGSPGQSTFQMAALSQTYQTYSGISLETCIIPNFVSNINTSNNTVAWFDDAGFYDTTLAVGQYTGSNLASALQTAFNVANIGHVVFYDSNSGYMTITAATGMTFKLVNNAFAKFVGIGDTVTIVNGSVSGYGPVRLDGPDYVDVLTSFQYPNVVHTANNNNTTFTRVPLIGAYGTTIYYSVTNPHICGFNPAYLRNIDITLRDPDGNLFNLPSNCHCAFTFRMC